MPNSDHFRYFIALNPEKMIAGDVAQQRQSRRDEAKDFVRLLKEWVAENNQEHMVSAVEVTLFGQIQIICDPAVIDDIRQQDILSIAEIRPAQGIDLSLRRVFDQVSG